MMKLGTFGAAAVFGLLISLALFTTGTFAQSAGQSIERSNISVSTHVAVEKTAAQGAARILLESTLLRPNGISGSCGNWGWGNGCGECGSWHGCFHEHENFRCASERVCRTIQVCHWAPWGRVCRGEHICHARSICRRCIAHEMEGWGRFAPWGVKR